MPLKRGLHRRIRTLHHRQDGATLVEFAVSAILFMTMIVGLAEFSLAMYTYHFISYSAQQAGRYAIVRGAHWTTACKSTSSYDCIASSTNVQDYVQSLAPPGVDPSSITVSTTWPGTGPSGSTTGCSTKNNDGCMVKITVQYPFATNMPLLPHWLMNFSASSEMVIQQ